MVCVVCALSSALAVWQVAAHGPLYRWDRAADADVLRAAAREPLLTPAARFAADLGNTAVALPVLACALVYAAWRHRRAGRARWWRPLAVQAVAMASAAPPVVALKALVARPAPGTGRLVAHSGYFPSGHAMTAATAYGLAALALAHSVRRAAVRRLSAATAALLVLTVGAGLVWHGYHWPLDVLASWCLSALLLAATRWCVRSRWASPG